jgi:hypothetical protein
MFHDGRDADGYHNGSHKRGNNVGDAQRFGESER